MLQINEGYEGGELPEEPCNHARAPWPRSLLLVLGEHSCQEKLLSFIVSRQMALRKIAPQLGLGFGFKLGLDLGLGVIFIGDICSRTHQH